MKFLKRRSLKQQSHPKGVVFHALHKSASMFLFKLFFRLSKEQRMAFYSGNLKVPTDHQVTPNIDHNFCLGPIRDFKINQTEFEPNIDIHRIFQLRDPRDILVSEYFSFGWIHTENRFGEKEQRIREKIKQQSIDDYVLEPGGASHDLVKRLDHLARNANKRNVTLVRYEQMVEDFPSWLWQVMLPFGFDKSSRFDRFKYQKYRWKYLRAFQADKTRRHKRNVKPGEHRIRLKPETIRELNRRFHPFQEWFELDYGARAA